MPGSMPEFAEQVAIRMQFSRAVRSKTWPPQDVITYAAMLMGIEPPPEQDVEAAGLSPLARSFYVENKRASNRKLKDELGVKLAFPTYRVGLEALWEAGEGR